MSIRRTGARLLLLALALLLVLGQPVAGDAAPSAQTVGRVRPGEVLVQLRPGASPERVAGRAGASLEATGNGRTRRMKVAAGQERARARQLQNDPDVLAAAPNFVREAADVTPNDPGYPAQWHLPQIKAPAAWDTTTGSSAVKVAVLDSGVDLAHPDLIANLQPGVNLLCTDPGWTPPSPTYCDAPTAQDDYGHGTHVTGILGAVGNNAVGVTGVAWTVAIVPVKVLDSSGSGTDAQIINGIDWAIANGARVINLSVGGPGDSAVLDAAVRRAWDAGLVVVVAAGNGATSEPYYPAASPGALAVAATSDTADHSSSYSNYGSDVAIAAPGDRIYSTLRLVEGGYGYKTGTSMATPQVAGAAALVIATRPGLDNYRVAGALFAAADKVGDFAYDVRGWNERLGFGRLDVAGAVTTAAADTAPVATLPTLRPRLMLPSIPKAARVSG